VVCPPTLAVPVPVGELLDLSRRDRPAPLPEPHGAQYWPGCP